MNATNQPAILAISKDGRRIFIKLRKSGIHPLIAMGYGMPITFFGKGRTAYLAVEDALAWFEKELPYDPTNPDYPKVIAIYRRVLQNFRKGQTQDF